MLKKGYTTLRLEIEKIGSNIRPFLYNVHYIHLSGILGNSIFLDRIRINFLGETQGYGPRRTRGLSEFRLESSSVQVSDIIFLYENLKNRDEVVNFRLEYRKKVLIDRLILLKSINQTINTFSE